MPTLRSIKELHISHNKLTSIQDIDTIFPSLDVLDISHNQITGDIKQFAGIIKKMKNLFILKLKGNPIAEIEKYV